ncbi:MAG: hypothetical protein IJY82_01070 [Oscillospiraceae bacterium]|nr:hypothetical protein [Oscillospiraceae bacterium]
MRKIDTTISLLLSILLVLSFAACQFGGREETSEPAVSSQGEESAAASSEPEPDLPKTAGELMDRIDQTMEQMTSYREDIVSEMTLFYRGYKMEATATAWTVITEDAFYEEGSTRYICKELNLDEQEKTMEAFYNGKMYLLSKDNTYTQKLCSEITKEEYKEIRKNILSEDIGLKECVNQTFSQKENGDWELSFSGYTKKTIDALMELMKVSDDYWGGTVVDLQVMYQSDAEYRAKTVQFSFVFEEEEGGDTPEFTITMTCSKYNSAEFDPSILNEKEYTLVDDAWILSKISSSILDMKNASAGSFTMECETQIKVKEEKQTTKETDAVSYGRKNGGYYYDIVAKTNDQTITIQYQNGTQTVSGGGETQTASLSEEDAKLFVDSLINAPNFTESAVTAIQKQKDGRYRLTVRRLSLEPYQEAYAQAGIDLENTGWQEFVILMADGQVATMESTITMVGVAGESFSTQVFNITLRHRLEFNRLEDDMSAA